jgi:hypothetical protein
MNMDAVVGCDAVDAGAAWLRLTTMAGPVRTIPWSSVKIAGMGGNHEGHVTIQGVTEKVSPYFATHDSLWLVTADGDLAQVMLEKSNPKREEIISAFSRNVPLAWRGNELTSGELTDQLFQIPMKSTFKMRKSMLVIMIVGLLLVLLLIALPFFRRS